MTISTIIIFLLILGVIVFIHELGHFVTAKFFGVKVEEFGLGFPPKIFGKKKGETEYTLNWIPLGGFVKIAGEDGENRDDPRSFGSKPVWQRTLILSAGVIMNFLLAAALFSFVLFAKFPQDISGVADKNLPANIDEIYVQVNSVVAGSPAEEAGLEAMDRILKIGDIEVDDTEDFENYSKTHPDSVAAITIQRGGETIDKEIFVRGNPPEGQGATGISISRLAVVQYSALGAIKEGFIYTADMAYLIVLSFVALFRELLFTGGTSMEVSGPVGMVTMTQQAAQLGVLVLINFTALISINLAILNILPLPALDGGRIVFLIAEKIKGRPVSQEFEAKIHNAGFMLLMLLMVIVTFKDVARLGIWERIVGMF